MFTGCVSWCITNLTLKRYYIKIMVQVDFNITREIVWLSTNETPHFNWKYQLHFRKLHINYCSGELVVINIIEVLSEVPNSLSYKYNIVYEDLWQRKQFWSCRSMSLITLIKYHLFLKPSHFGYFMRQWKSRHFNLSRFYETAIRAHNHAHA
jgi:hypothetical protein